MTTLVVLPEPVRHALETLPDPYLILSPDLLVLAASTAYLQAMHLPRAAVVGRPWQEGLPAAQHTQGLEALATALRQVLATGQPQRLPPQRYEVPPPDRSESISYYASLTTPVFDTEGQVYYLLHKLEPASAPLSPPTSSPDQPSETRLQKAEVIGQLGSYEGELPTMHFYFSDNLFRLLGYAPQSFVPTLDWLDSVTEPEDVALVHQIIDQAVLTKRAYQYHRRIFRPDGQQRHLVSTGQVVCDAAGQPLKLVGTVQDVTEQLQAAAALQQHIQRLQQSEQVASLGSWEYTVATGTLVWSEGLYRVLGLPPGSPVGPHTYLDFVVPDDYALAELLLRQAEQGQLAFEENVRVAVAGQVKTLRIKALQLPDAHGRPERLLGVALDISVLTRLEAENLQLTLRQQQALLAATVQAQEEERRRIGESLHNGLGQLLYATKLQFDQLTTTPLLASAPELAAAQQATKRLLSEAMRQTRIISHELMPGLVEAFGLETALRDICQGLHSSSFRLHCLTFLDEAHPLPKPLEVVLYRLAQELTQNVVKHAQATQATLEVETLPGWVVLRVEDNGQGFAPATAQVGIGLRTLRERVALFGGTVHIDSAPAQGTHVQVRLPLLIL